MIPRGLGELVDRLSIINVKLFMAQEEVHEAARNELGVEPDTVAKLVVLNRDRSRTMQAIDECLDAAVRSGSTTVERRIKTG